MDEDEDFLERNVWAEGSDPKNVTTANRDSPNKRSVVRQHSAEDGGEADVTTAALHSALPVDDDTLNEPNPWASRIHSEQHISEPELQDDVAEYERIDVPPLISLLPDADRISFAALCFQTFHELSYRYCRYEFIEPAPVSSLSTQLQNAAEAVSRPASALARAISRPPSATLREPTYEDAALLDLMSDPSDNEVSPNSKKPMFYADFEKTTSSDFPSLPAGTDEEHDETAPSKLPLVFQSGTSSPTRINELNERLSKLSFAHGRCPFGDEMDNPETVVDMVTFNRALHGNILLCNVFKQFNALSFDFMDRIYVELNIMPQERSFIEDGVRLGLKAKDIAKSISLVQAEESGEKSYAISNILFNMLAILVTIKQGKYDSFSRSFFRTLTKYLGLDWIDVLENVEIPFIETLAPIQDPTAQQGQDHLRKLEELERRKVDDVIEKKRRKKRIVYTTAAAFGGGAIIGLTTGLAAPLVGAGIGAVLATMKVASGAAAFFSSVGGTALITSGGVLTGTSLGGRSMEMRTRDVEYFKFVPVGGRGASTIICISGWLNIKEGKGKDVPTATSTRSRSHTSSSVLTDNLSKNCEKDTASDSASIKTAGTPEKHIRAVSEPDRNIKIAETELTEELIAKGEQELLTPFMGMSPVNGEQVNFVFDPHILKTLGDALKMFASELISFSANQLLAQTILSTLMSGLTWPMWVAKLGYLVDNPWSNGLDRSKKAGKILADNIKSNNRSVSLVGYSLGARTIYYCLLELAQKGILGLVEDVFLFGAPILIPSNKAAFENRDNANLDPNKCQDFCVNPDLEGSESPNRTKELDEWRMVLSVVSGRFVNAFSRTDWVLGFLFRGSVAGMWDVAGLRPLLVDSMMDIRKVEDYDHGKYISASKDNAAGPEPITLIENIDITSKIVGHMSYRAAMPQLLNKICGFETWSEDLEVIEEVVGGEWIEKVDGFWGESEAKKKRKRQWTKSLTNLSKPKSSTSLNEKKPTAE